MSDGTKIEWADATLNYVNGCSVLSPGCKLCYAMKQAHRFPVRQGLTVKTSGGMVWTGEVRAHEPALLQALKWKRPRRIFWNAHGDLFHENVPNEWIDRQFAVMALTPQHIHMVLTKRPERMREYLTGSHRARVAEAVSKMDAGADARLRAIVRLNSMQPLPNVWAGTSVEDQPRAHERIPHLLATPAAIRFLSCEPLLGPVWIWHELILARANALLGQKPSDPVDGIDWVIVGGESGGNARPMHPDWARRLRDQCAAAGVPFFFKQFGEWALPDEAREAVDSNFNLRLRRGDGVERGKIHIFEDTCTMIKVGKKLAGNHLDGVQHLEMPS